MNGARDESRTIPQPQTCVPSGPLPRANSDPANTIGYDIDRVLLVTDQQYP